MIKRLFLLCFFIFSAFQVWSQKYGNEWINYSQPYYRINIPKTGLYHIDSTTLANSGIPLTSLNPKNFQLFIKGQEQYIYLNGENDNVFNNGDYIEFFAEKNNGRFDSLAYSNITHLPNPYYALFNDTNYAYLSWNASTNNKRVILETDLSFSSYTPASYFYSEKVLTSNNYYSVGRSILSTITDPRYVETEGYGFSLGQGASVQTYFGNLLVYPSSTLPVFIHASYSGASENYTSSGFDHELLLEYYDYTNTYVPLFDTTFFSFVHLHSEKQITSDKLQNSSHLKITSVNHSSFSAISNLSNIHYLYLKYPQLTDLAGASEQVFFVDDNLSSSKTFLDLQNVSVGTSSVILYDLSNHKYMSNVVTGTHVQALIPNSGSQKKCFLTTTSNILNVTSLAPVNQSGFFVNHKLNLPDSAYLIVSHKALQASANDFKLYRQSMSGGSNQVILAYVDELYDQFAYGNKKNPLAIKNFCSYLSDSLPTPPKYLLLLGKSIKNDQVKTGGIYWNACDVPTMGYPASDNLITTGLHGSNSSTPFIPVGRVSGRTDAEITSYLNKVKSHELGLTSLQPDDWHKRVLHFAGGSDAFQQQLFKTYLKSYEDIIEDTLYGGRVFSFYKTSTAPIQITVSDSVKQLIDYGASMITFFGHGSTTGFDQAIDDPAAYNNKDKYPLFIANSCYSGDIHTYDANSASEKFILINDKGSIGFIASSSTGVVNPLNTYSTELYKSLASGTYYKGIGDAIKNTCQKNSVYNDFLLEITSLEMTLEGDPFVKLNAFKKPDYEITNASVFLDPNAYIDSIGVNIAIKNNGRALKDSFVVRTERYFPSGDSVTFYNKIYAPFNHDTLRFSIIKDLIKGVGLNRFKVFIDYYNEISELSESNNSTTGSVDLFISGGDVVPVYPYKYAIIPNASQVTLKASTADPFAAFANYRIQLDTNSNFSNPIQTTLVNSMGGVIEWTVSLPFADSTVYFWRITRDSVLPNDRINWRESSFQVIGTKTGWSQAHFHQFKNDGYQFIKYLPAQRKFEFFNDLVVLKCRDAFSNVINYADIQYSLNNSVQANWHFAFNGWSIAVLDSVSIKPWTSTIIGSPGYASPYNNCLAFSDENRASFDFGQTSYCGSTPNWQSDLLNFMNAIPVNDYVLAYSTDAHYATTYSNSLYQAFESIGSNSIRTVSDSLPMIIFGKKRSVPVLGSATEIIGATPNSVINLEDSINTKWNKGYIESELIGPSNKWLSLHWKYVNQASLAGDTVILKVIGFNTNGSIDTLATFLKDSSDVYDLYNYVDAVNYPTIKLIAWMKDNSFHLAPQLKKWQVIYDNAPECAINPVRNYILPKDTLQEGDQLLVNLPIENIGTLPFTDSLLVTYWIEDRNRVMHVLPQRFKQKPFIPAQVIVDTIAINTYQYIGQNYLWVDVNPPGKSGYQKEQYHFNNIARIPFLVNTDKINPLLDVTFDGTHILNGDIISAKPHVLITLKDENKFLALNDTSNFAVYIRYPGQASDKRLYFNKGLQFTPANLPSNSCKIEWMPELAEDGKYTLIVQAADRSKNVSGAMDYTIQFEVVTKQTVTEVLNYPNPFSTSTRFVFTLTGSEVPDVFIIQIMTITGKVVKEITKNELGNIHIGRNITEYAWNGKDEYGDKLANGVYLYRVITRHNGQAIEKYKTEADSYFKKGMGKMVIMR